MIGKNDLTQIRKDIETCIGQKVQLKANKGRKKAFIREGVLENTYPSIFIVKFENDYEATRRVSYSYTDILTKAVELVVCKDNKRIQVS
ncbi:MAG: Veg family protein [Clostridia bacterium]|nr:Veg family protein [Clostridia bacterium]